jgi:hypothetical protein
MSLPSCRGKYGTKASTGGDLLTRQTNLPLKHDGRTRSHSVRTPGGSSGPVGGAILLLRLLFETYGAQAFHWWTRVLYANKGSASITACALSPLKHSLCPFTPLPGRILIQVKVVAARGADRLRGARSGFLFITVR